MFRRIFGGSQYLYPAFRELSVVDLLTPLSNSLVGKIYYTPKIQKVMYTDELAKYMAFLSRKNKIDSSDMKKLTENILT